MIDTMLAVVILMVRRSGLAGDHLGTLVGGCNRHRCRHFAARQAVQPVAGNEDGKADD